MKRKHNQCYLLLGTMVMLLVACLCSFIFVKGNLEQAARKSSFESIYVKTKIDFIIPGPSDSQVEQLESADENGIAVVTPYYETTTTININDTAINATTIIFPVVEKMEYTPYNAERITNGAKSFAGGEAIVDQMFAEINHCGIGDEATISIADHDYSFRIVSIAETNTYYSTGTIAMILSAEESAELEALGIRYSAAYVSASDLDACETYLYSEYKPLSRLKDKSEFENDDVYDQHFQNFTEADWSKEITNCQENYEALSVKYDNVQTGIWSNIVIMSVIIAVVIIVFNSVLLTLSSMKNFMKAFLVKKSGTKDAIKAFYKSGIIENAVVFCVASTGLYMFLAIQTHSKPYDFQVLINCLVPIIVTVIISAIMVGVTSSYVDKHYKIKTIKKKGSAEEVQVEVI